MRVTSRRQSRPVVARRLRPPVVGALGEVVVVPTVVEVGRQRRQALVVVRPATLVRVSDARPVVARGRDQGLVGVPVSRVVVVVAESPETVDGRQSPASQWALGSSGLNSRA